MCKGFLGHQVGGVRIAGDFDDGVTPEFGFEEGGERREGFFCLGVFLFHA